MVPGKSDKQITNYLNRLKSSNPDVLQKALEGVPSDDFKPRYETLKIEIIQ